MASFGQKSGLQCVCVSGSDPQPSRGRGAAAKRIEPQVRAAPLLLKGQGGGGGEMVAPESGNWSETCAQTQGRHRSMSGDRAPPAEQQDGRLRSGQKLEGLRRSQDAAGGRWRETLHGPQSGFQKATMWELQRRIPGGKRQTGAKPDAGAALSTRVPPPWVPRGEREGSEVGLGSAVEGERTPGVSLSSVPASGTPWGSSLLLFGSLLWAM